MSGPHAHAHVPREIPADPKIVRAAQFLADNPTWETGLRRQLREQFGIDDGQIMDALLLANDMRQLRRAFG